MPLLNDVFVAVCRCTAEYFFGIGQFLSEGSEAEGDSRFDRPHRTAHDLCDLVVSQPFAESQNQSLTLAVVQFRDNGPQAVLPLCHLNRRFGGRNRRSVGRCSVAQHLQLAVVHPQLTSPSPLQIQKHAIEPCKERAATFECLRISGEHQEGFLSEIVGIPGATGHHEGGAMEPIEVLARNSFDFERLGFVGFHRPTAFVLRYGPRCVGGDLPVFCRRFSATGRSAAILTGLMYSTHLIQPALDNACRGGSIRFRIAR